MTAALPTRHKIGLRGGGAIVAVLAFSYWFTDLAPFSTAASRALLVPIVVLIAIAETRRFRRRAHTASSTTFRARWFRIAIAVWSAIAAAVVAWELFALRSSPRSEHPTISSFVETVEQHHVGRIVLFLAWLWLGWTLAS